MIRIFFSLALTMAAADSAWAQYFPGGALGGPVPGAYYNPATMAYGTGQVFTAMPCQYGNGGWAPQITRSVGSDIVTGAQREYVNAEQDAFGFNQQVNDDQHDEDTARDDLSKDLKLSPGTFVKAIDTCNNLIDQHANSGNSADIQCASRRGGGHSRPAGPEGSNGGDEHEQFDNCPAGVRNFAANCNNATSQSAEEVFCSSSDYLRGDSDSQSCLEHLQTYRDAAEKVSQDKKDQKEKKRDLDRAKRAYQEAKRDAAKLQQDMASNPSLYSAANNGCPQCTGGVAGGGANHSTRDFIAGLGVAGGGELLQYLEDRSAMNTAAKLGYPMANPYPGLAIGGAMAAYPFINAAMNGGTNGGMAQGGYGCAPTVSSPYFGGGAFGMGYPIRAGVYAGMGYPYGGGMYMPGMTPWGMNGPWGIFGSGMGGYPGIMGGINFSAGLGGMGGFYPGTYPGLYPLTGGFGGFGGFGSAGMYPNAGLFGAPGSAYGLPGLGALGGLGGMAGLGAYSGYNYQNMMMMQQMQALQAQQRALQYYNESQMYAGQTLSQGASTLQNAMLGSYNVGGYNNFPGAIVNYSGPNYLGVPPVTGGISGGISAGFSAGISPSIYPAYGPTATSPFATSPFLQSTMPMAVPGR